MASESSIIGGWDKSRGPQSVICLPPATFPEKHVSSATRNSEGRRWGRRQIGQRLEGIEVRYVVKLARPRVLSVSGHSNVIMFHLNKNLAESGGGTPLLYGYGAGASS